MTTRGQMAELLEVIGGVYDQALEVLSGVDMDAILWVSNVDDMITYPALYEEYSSPGATKQPISLNLRALPWCVIPTARIKV